MASIYYDAMSWERKKRGEKFLDHLLYQFERHTMMPKPVYIGVDPAFRAGGFTICILDMTEKTAVTKTLELLAFHDWLRSPDAPESCFVCVENSNLQNQSFDTRGNRDEIARKSRNVGCNQAVSQLAYESALKRYGPKNVFQVSPREKGKKITDARMFAAILQQDGILIQKLTLNQDERDAYMLATIARRMALRSGAFSR